MEFASVSKLPRNVFSNFACSVAEQVLVAVRETCIIDVSLEVLALAFELGGAASRVAVVVIASSLTPTLATAAGIALLLSSAWVGSRIRASMTWLSTRTSFGAHSAMF